MQIFDKKVEMFCHKTYFDSILHSFCAKKKSNYNS